MTDSKLAIILTVQDKASGSIKRISGSLTRMEKDSQKFAQAALRGHSAMRKEARKLADQYAKTAERAKQLSVRAAASGNLRRAGALAEHSKQAGETAKQYRKAANESSRFGKKVKQLGGQLEKATKILAGVAVVGATLKKAFVFAEQGAGFIRLKDSSATLAKSMGGDFDLIVSKVKAASNNTVAEIDVMSAAARAMALGLGTDADKLANLMEVAALKGRALGLSTTQAFNDIVTGVGRMSPLILDNLGIVVDAVPTYKEYAASIGKTAAQLTSAEKRQALLNRVLEEGNVQLEKAGGLTEDAASKFERLNAIIKDQEVKVKSWLATGLVPWVDALTGFDGVVEKHADEVLFAAESYEEYAAEIDRANEATPIFLDMTIALTEEQFNAARALQRATSAGSGWAAGMGTMEEATADFNEEIEKTPEQLEAATRALEVATGQGEAFRDALTKPISVRVSVDAPNMIQQLGLKELGIDNIEDAIPLIMSPSLDSEAAAEFAQQAELMEVAAQIRVEAIEVDEATKQLIADGLAPDAAQAAAMLQPLLDASPAQFNTMGQILKSKLVNAVSSGQAQMALALQNAFQPAVSPLVAAVDAVKSLDGSTIDIEINYTGDVPGFQHGGSFIVGGRGGVDSEMVAFKATPGERVTIDNSNNSQNFGPFNVSNEVDGQALIESLKTQVRRM